MREIKFRAWDELNGKMRNVDALEWYESGLRLKEASKRRKDLPAFSMDNAFQIMQFTGLKDKNGKDIYEGDIVRIGSFVPEIWQVGFDRGGFCFFNEGDMFYNDIKYCEDGEVIGNIYENPELLKP